MLDDESNSIAIVDPPPTRQALPRQSNDGWNLVFHPLEPLSDADLARTLSPSRRKVAPEEFRQR